MKKQTALQEVILDIDERIANLKTWIPEADYAESAIGLLERIKTKIEPLLPKERADIEDAYDTGWNNGYRKEFDGAKKYFTNTFKTISDEK